MSCSPSPVASACWHDVDAAYPGKLTFLGIVGDQAHQTHTSSHNCAPMQESGDYNPDYAHALDIGHGGNRTLAAEIRNYLLKDYRVRYVLDDGTGYKPDGSTFDSFDHTEHVHVSFLPGTTFDVRPFIFGDDDMPLNAQDLAAIRAMIQNNADGTEAVVKAQHEDTKTTVRNQAKALLDYANAVAEESGVDAAKVRARLRPVTKAILDLVD